MQPITWTEDMSVGAAALDDDHRRLIAMLATLGQAVDGTGRDSPLPLLHDLAEYCRAHFAREEAYMAAIGYPRLHEHQRQHDLLSQDVAEALSDQSGEPDPDLAGKLHTFLQGWLFDHILGSDKSYARYAATVGGYS
jgi:hemerythrin